MKKNGKMYIRFLCSMAKVGCIGFGGGSILIPVIEQEVINNQKLGTKEELDKDVIVASITPGALPVEISGSVGRREFGIWGMIMGAVCMALPGCLATILLLAGISNATEEVLRIIDFLSIGIATFIIYLLTKYIYSVQKGFYKESKKELLKTLFIMLVVFLLSSGKNVFAMLGIDKTPIFAVSTIDILLVVFFFAFYTRGKYTYKHLIIAMILGGIYLLGKGKARLVQNEHVLLLVSGLMLILAAYGLISSILKNHYQATIEKRKLFGDVAGWLVMFFIFFVPAVYCYPDIIQFIGNTVLSVFMSFGGGDAYLTVADGLFVNSGMITENQYYSQIVSVVNILPGSILCKTVSGIGYYLGLNIYQSILAALIFAFVGFVSSVVVSCGFYSIVFYLYDSLIHLNIFQTISRFIRPIIAGLLLNIMLSLCNQCLEVSEIIVIEKSTILIGLVLGYLLNLFLALKCKINTTIVLLIDVGATLLIYVGFFV